MAASLQRARIVIEPGCHLGALLGFEETVTYEVGSHPALKGGLSASLSNAAL